MTETPALDFDDYPLRKSPSFFPVRRCAREALRAANLGDHHHSADDEELYLLTHTLNAANHATDAFLRPEELKDFLQHFYPSETIAAIEQRSPTLSREERQVVYANFDRVCHLLQEHEKTIVK